MFCVTYGRNANAELMHVPNRIQKRIQKPAQRSRLEDKNPTMIKGGQAPYEPLLRIL